MELIRLSAELVGGKDGNVERLGAGRALFERLIRLGYVDSMTDRGECITGRSGRADRLVSAPR